VGVFSEIQGGRFKLNPLAATLRSDAPQSMRDFALLMVDDYNWRVWQEFPEVVRTSRNAFASVHGVESFENLEKHPEKGRIFAQAMASLSRAENPAIVETGDFSKIRTLVDVGGSQGHLLAEVVRANPRMNGVLFDLPSAVERARQAAYLNAKGIVSQVELVGEDFFQSVPEGADAYTMKYVLHDWDDELCIRILENCRRAMAWGGRVFVVDTVIPGGNGPHSGKLLDINMLVLTGGHERTVSEFKDLFAGAGFKLKRILPTACPLSIVEGHAG
jgi:O-methyltransferase